MLMLTSSVLEKGEYCNLQCVLVYITYTYSVSYLQVTSTFKIHVYSV